MIMLLRYRCITLKCEYNNRNLYADVVKVYDEHMTLSSVGMVLIPRKVN